MVAPNGFAQDDHTYYVICPNEDPNQAVWSHIDLNDCLANFDGQLEFYYNGPP
jgi:hypothetical protein